MLQLLLLLPELPLLLLNLYAVKLIAYEVWADDWLSFWQMSN